jgi:hypothetical protein
MAEARKGGVQASARCRPAGWGGSGNPLSFGSARFPKPPDSASAFGHRVLHICRMGLENRLQVRSTRFWSELASAGPNGRSSRLRPGRSAGLTEGACFDPMPNGRSSGLRLRGSTGAKGRGLPRPDAERPDFGSVVARIEVRFDSRRSGRGGASAPAKSANGSADLVPAGRRGRSPLRRLRLRVTDEACLAPNRGNPRRFGAFGNPGTAGACSCRSDGKPLWLRPRR